MRLKAQPVRHDGYPLRTVAGETGLTPDIIRAWERRYQVVQPVRGPRGARLYNADDIAHLRMIARVVAGGRAIGDVARLDRKQLEALAGHRATTSAADHHVDGHPVVSKVLESLEQFDDTAVGHRLGDALVGLGPREFVFQVAVPLIYEVGERWSAGRLSIADEHLLSATLRSLFVGLTQNRAQMSGPTLLLATPSGERHELGLLLVALLAADSGFGLTYLGADLPAGEIIAAATRSDASVVGIGAVNSENRQRAVDEIRIIENGLAADVQLWLGGRDAPAIAEALGTSRARVVADLSLLDAEFARIASGARHRR